ncbi:MAG TPA: molybdate ABC transporter substrate-binding protein [Spongiibacteraceae bacterium]|jgi:molybdate transport system substrate-binding protein|nr:molybdate ABC transporter substrate-binding protein [Spongiibacteraceae bacterium]HUH37621.1 molybdate ABC transporter substrate-binding protein [Spongiibacteraceae bacterium]
MFKRVRWWWLAACAFALPLQAAEATVAVASNFAAPMAELAKHFERETGHRLTLAFGSSGKIFAQIQNGAPYAVFLSADQAKPRALEAAGRVTPRSRFTYAVGRLVLWSADPARVDSDATVLRSGAFRKLALANPRLAPYGEAALQTLTALDLVETTRARWVQGENIAQTYQFVSTGNADIGFVALSQVATDGVISSGSGWLVPANLHEPIRQDAVLLRRGRFNPAAIALMDYLRTDDARAVMQRFGYSNPEDYSPGD